MQNNRKIQQNKFKFILLYVKRNFITIILNVLVVLFFIYIIYNLALQAKQKEDVINVISNVTTVSEQCLSSSIQENDTYANVAKQIDEELNLQLDDDDKQTEENINKQQEVQNIASNAIVDTDSITTQYYDIPLTQDIQEYLFKICNEYSVPIPLLLAVIETESGFNIDSISSTDDYGLCQINIINHEHLSEVLGITNIMDPKQNILCSVYILSGHLNYTNGDIQLALMCYNCGQGGAQNLWNQGIYTTDYVDKVMSRYYKYVR